MKLPKWIEDKCEYFYVNEQEVNLLWSPGDATKYRIIMHPVDQRMSISIGYTAHDYIWQLTLLRSNTEKTTMVCTNRVVYPRDINEDNAHTRVILAGLWNTLCGHEAGNIQLSDILGKKYGGPEV